MGEVFAVRPIRWFLLLFLLWPYVALVFYIQKWSWFEFSEFLPVFIFTLKQAFASAFFSLVLGSLGAFGLLSVRSPMAKRGLELLTLLPNIVPTLFVIVAGLNAVTLLGPFPFGFLGVVLLHTVLNAGLVSLSLSRVMNQKLGRMAELAYVEGAGFCQFLGKGVVGYLKRDIFLIFLFVFSVCMASFAVPLIVGGVSGTTLEVLIYNKIRVSGDISQALSLGLFQCVTLLSLSFFLSSQKTKVKNQTAHFGILSRPLFLIIPLGFSALVLSGLFVGALSGLQQIFQHSVLREQTLAALQGSFIVSMGVGILLLALLSALAFVVPHKRFQRFLLGYVSPSSVIVGFAWVLIMGWDNDMLVYAGLIIGISLISLPLGYRYLGDGALTALEHQRVVAKTLGASPIRVWWEIVLPQVFPVFCFLSGLAAFWACGDFALSSVVSGQDITLALVTKSLLGSYRLEMATGLVWVLFAVGGFVFLIFGGLGHVVHRKFSA